MNLCTKHYRPSSKEKHKIKEKVLKIVMEINELMFAKCPESEGYLSVLTMTQSLF